MAHHLTRRGLFRAVSATDTSSAALRDDRHFARIGAFCLETRGTSCRRCTDSCDVSAIRFRPMGGGRAIALLDQGACTGCGDCLPVCPVNAIELVSKDRAALVAGLVGETSGVPEQ
jgi:ferredoxin-type protein NapF